MVEEEEEDILVVLVVVFVLGIVISGGDDSEDGDDNNVVFAIDGCIEGVYCCDCDCVFSPGNKDHERITEFISVLSAKNLSKLVLRSIESDSRLGNEETLKS